MDEEEFNTWVARNPIECEVNASSGTISYLLGDAKLAEFSNVKLDHFYPTCTLSCRSAIEMHVQAPRLMHMATEGDAEPSSARAPVPFFGDAADASSVGDTSFTQRLVRRRAPAVKASFKYYRFTVTKVRTPSVGACGVSQLKLYDTYGCAIPLKRALSPAGTPASALSRERKASLRQRLNLKQSEYPPSCAIDGRQDTGACVAPFERSMRIS